MENLTNQSMHFNLVKNEACIYIISIYTLRINSSAVSQTLKLMLLGMKWDACTDVGILNKNWNQMKETSLQYINIPFPHSCFLEGWIGGLLMLNRQQVQVCVYKLLYYFLLMHEIHSRGSPPFPQLLPVRPEPQKTHTLFDSLIMKPKYWSHYVYKLNCIEYYIILEFVEGSNS